VVAVASARVGEAASGEDVGQDRSLPFRDYRADIYYLTDELARDRDHAIGVADQEVAGAHLNAADRDRATDIGNLHPVLASAHEPAAAVDGIAAAKRPLHVTADAVDHRAAHAPVGRHRGEDVAPNGTVGAAAVVEHHHRARRDVV
jgi:hypothetical protein